MIHCLYCNFSSIYYLLLHIDVLHDIPALISFSTINSISISVNNSNSSSVFFKHACHANPGADKKQARSSSYISIHLFIYFQIHVQVIMYHFERTNYDIHLDFSFPRFSIIFCILIISI